MTLHCTAHKIWPLGYRRQAREARDDVTHNLGVSDSLLTFSEQYNRHEAARTTRSGVVLVRLRCRGVRSLRTGEIHHRCTLTGGNLPPDNSRT